MKQNEFPKDWDEAKVQKVIGHYERQGDEDAVAEDEADIASTETGMTVPHDLVATVR